MCVLPTRIVFKNERRIFARPCRDLPPGSGCGCLGRHVGRVRREAARRELHNLDCVRSGFLTCEHAGDRAGFVYFRPSTNSRTFGRRSRPPNESPPCFAPAAFSWCATCSCRAH